MSTLVPTLRTPFKDFLPPLLPEEYASLEADLLERGLLQDIQIDEHLNVLDGHHRYEVCRKHGLHFTTRTITGFESELEKQAYVCKVNLARRNLSSEAAKKVRAGQIVVYGKLRSENPKKWTLEKIACECGVDRTTVGKWFSNEESPIPKQDARRRIPAGQEKQIAKELESGKSTSEVARKHGISKGRVSQINKVAKGGASRGDQNVEEDQEMEQLIAEGEEYLRRARDCFFPFPDEVAAAAVNEILGKVFDLRAGTSVNKTRKEI